MAPLIIIALIALFTVWAEIGRLQRIVRKEHEKRVLVASRNRAMNLFVILNTPIYAN